MSSALFVKIAKESKTYHIDDKLEPTFTPEQTEFLRQEREGKTPVHSEKVGLRDKLLLKI